MKSAGFRLREVDGQTILDFVMPETLCGIFSVSLYGKGPLLELAEGSATAFRDLLGNADFLPADMVVPHQVHGTAVVSADREFALPLRPKADGVYLDGDSSTCASLRFADCAPVVVACASEKPWLLVLHSGFAGTAQNICGNALAETLKGGQGRGEDRLYAWIAPVICGKCYTRRAADPSTAMAMESFFSENFSVVGDIVYFDLRGEIRRQLEQSGVAPEDIYTSEFCTACDNDKFYSYRVGNGGKQNFLLAADAIKLGL